MKLDSIVEHLESARLAHLRWVARAEGLVNGLPLDKDQVPVLPTDCAFGEWYNGEGRALRSLSSFSGLEVPHANVHYTYQQIFKLLYGDDDRSLLGKWFGSTKEYHKERLEEAADLLPRLKADSKVLLQGLDLLEREVSIKAKHGVVNLSDD